MTTLARLVEVHRLAVAGGQAVIARDVGDRVGRVWLPRSRFADVAALAEATLTLGPDAGAFYHLGWAQTATGQPRPALASYQQACTGTARPATAATKPPPSPTSATCTTGSATGSMP
jgi:hypothetical protein